MNSATNTKSPPIGRLSPRALSLVETFSLFAFSPSLSNGVVALARTKTNQRNLTCPNSEWIGKKPEFRSDREGGKGTRMPDHGRGKGGKGLGKGGAKRHRKVEKGFS